MAETSSTPALQRRLGLGLLMLYGLGTIIGAGIYVLIGKVAGQAGMFAPISFALAAVIALFTGLSYAELSARYPVSAGEAYYVRQGLGLPWLSSLVGWLVILTGVVSAATIANGFVGYLQVFVDAPSWLAISLLVLALGALSCWGILESVVVAAAITLVELVGLLLVIVLARGSLAELPARFGELLPPATAAAWSGIALGGFLAFYAFIGFEDMVNVAEEVRDPVRNLPRAIFLAIGLSTVLYVVVSVTVVLALPLPALQASEAPLSDVIAARGRGYQLLIAALSLTAVVNGALVQVIMASRVLYGMGARRMAPRWLSAVEPRTGTPVRATLLVTGVVLVFALALPLESLARLTSFVVLIVFALVNYSLCRLKRPGGPPSPGISLARWIPWTGLLLCLAALAAQLLLPPK